MVVCSVCWQEHNPLVPRKFHSFPSNAERREEWFKSIGRTIKTYKTARICSDHFTEDDYYDTGKTVQLRRLKNTAVPSVFFQKFCKRKSKEDSIIGIPHDSIVIVHDDSQIDFQYDDEQDTIEYSAIEVQQDSTIQVQNENKQNSIMDIQYDSEHDSTTEVQQYSPIEVQQDSTIHVQHENENSIIDIQHDSEQDSIIDDQHDSEHDSIIDVQQDNDVGAEAPLDKKNGKSEKNRKRKRSDISQLEKVFVKTGKYQTECLKKTDFANVEAWNTFLKFLMYTRHLSKLSREQNIRLRHKIESVQTMAEKLKMHYIETMRRANEKNTQN